MDLELKVLKLEDSSLSVKELICWNEEYAKKIQNGKKEGEKIQKLREKKIQKKKKNLNDQKKKVKNDATLKTARKNMTKKRRKWKKKEKRLNG